MASLIADAAFSSVPTSEDCIFFVPHIISSAIKFVSAHTPSMMNHGRSIPLLAPMRKIMPLRTWFTWIDRKGVFTVLVRREGIALTLQFRCARVKAVDYFSQSRARLV